MSFFQKLFGTKKEPVPIQGPARSEDLPLFTIPWPMFKTVLECTISHHEEWTFRPMPESIRRAYDWLNEMSSQSDNITAYLTVIPPKPKNSYRYFEAKLFREILFEAGTTLSEKRKKLQEDRSFPNIVKHYIHTISIIGNPTIGLMDMEQKDNAKFSSLWVYLTSDNPYFNSQEDINKGEDFDNLPD